MFVSGFLMVLTNILRGKRSWRSFASIKFKRLIIPFITLSAVTFIPRSLLSTYADEPLELSLQTFLKSFVYPDYIVIPYFWFLQSSFTLLITVFLILSFSSKIRIKDILTYPLLIILFVLLHYFPIIGIQFFSLYKTCELGIFFILGCCYARCYRAIDSHIPWSKTSFLFICSAVWAILFFLTEYTIYSPVCSLTGICMCISIAKAIESNRLNFLDHMLGTNYIIFLLSWYFNIASQQLLHHFVDWPWWIFSILSLITGIYVPWIFYKYMEKKPKSRITKGSTIFLGQSFKHHQ